MKSIIFTLPLAIITLALAGCSSDNQESYAGLNLNAKYSKSRSVSHFNDYVHFLKQKAAGAGVSAKTLNAQKFIHYNARAVQLDQQQAARRRDPNVPPPPPNPSFKQSINSSEGGSGK